MGVVTLALARGPESFAKLVVLKRLHVHLLGDPSSVQMLLKEAQISARISHPNVVQVYEVAQYRGSPTIVMEYLEGLPLSELAKAPAPLPLSLHLAVLIQVLKGLDAAHELVDYEGRPLQLVHRDMSPHNVFVGYDGVVKVLDFGIAKITNSDEGATRTGMLKGKLRYMAPEQAGGGALDRRSDIFSVGVMLWEALAGWRLWGDADDVRVLRDLLCGNIPPLPRENIDPRLQRICERALAVNADERYQTAAEFRGALQACLESQSGEFLDEGLSKFMVQHFGARRDDMRARIADCIRCSTSPPPSYTRTASHSDPTLQAGSASWLTTPARLAMIGGLLAIMAPLAWLGARAVARHPPGAGAAAPRETPRETGRATSASPQSPCEPGFKSCAGRCVSSDRPEHGCSATACTPCLRASATPRCGPDGSCEIAVCYRGYDDCDGIAENGCETSLRTDPRHCGSCGAACRPLPHAQVGCGDTCRIYRCDLGYEDCNGITDDGCETRTDSDAHHCGWCGNACPAKQHCQRGRCVP
jgi:serine/threonine protein kinase